MYLSYFTYSKKKKTFCYLYQDDTVTMLIYIFLNFSIVACQCYRHADSCHYNKSLDHGVCDDCYHNTTGLFCEQCVQKFYRNMSKPLDDPQVCLRKYLIFVQFVSVT